MSIETIALGLLTNIIYDTTKKMLDLSIEQFKSSFDKKCLNKPFYLAFKKTCEYFEDEKKNPFVINKELLKNLKELDNVAVELFFSKININYEQIKNNFNCSFISNGLKQFISINYPNESYEEDFFKTWEYVFKTIYREIFKDLCSKDNILFTKFMIDTVGIVLSDLDDIKNKIEHVVETTNDTNTTLKTEIPQIQQKLDILVNNQSIFETDKLLLPLKIFFDNKEFIKCLDTIIDSYEININNYTKEQKSKIYNYKGACELNLNKLNDASASFKKSIDFETSDKALANLCKCYLNLGKLSFVSDCISEFKDKTSELYQEIKFYELFYSQENIEEAEKHLEKNKAKIKNYNHLKGRLLQRQLAPHQTIIEFFQKYLTENPDDRIAKYELMALRFSEIFDGNLIQFSFGTTQDFKLKVYPVNNARINADKLNQLIIDIQDLLTRDLEKFYKISLMLMISILCSQRADLSIANKYKTEIITNIDEIKDEFNANNACMVCFLLNDFENAYSIYNKCLNKLEDTTNILILILFGLGKFSDCKKLFTENEIQGLNVLKLLVQYKEDERENFIREIQDNYENYELKDQLLILDLCFEEKEYDFCKNKYINIVNMILSKATNMRAEVILMLAGKLDFFKELSLRDELLEFQWKSNPTLDNFEIGLRCAIKLYNNKQFSDCIIILNELNKFQPNNDTVQELYRNIDICNYSYNGIITDYENGNKNEKYLYYVAIAYINNKKFDKASKVIEELKYIDNQKFNYYHTKSILYVFTEAFDDLFRLLIEAYRFSPDDFEINKLIFNIVIFHCKNVKLPEEFKSIYQQVIKFLTENKIIYQFKVSNENPIEDLKNAMNSVEPIEENRRRCNSIKELFKQYEAFMMPIQLIYPFINKNKIDFWEEFLNNPSAAKNITNVQQMTDLSKNFKSLDKNPNILIDFESLILLNELGIENEIKEVLNLKISNFTVKDIKEYLLTYENNKSEGSLLVDTNNNLHFNVNSNIPEKYIGFLKSIISNYDQINFQSSNITNAALVKASEKLDCPDIFNNAFVASQSKTTIVWLDGVLSSIYNEFGVETITTVEILQYLMVRKILSNDKLASLKVKLCKLNCRFIPVSANDLYYSLLKDFKDFVFLLDTFNSKIFTQESLVFVIKSFIVKINDDKISKLQVPLIIKTIFDKFMFLYPNGDFIFNLILSLASSFIFLSDTIQSSIGINLMTTINPKITMGFYNNLIIALNKSIPEINPNKNIFMQKIISNIPLEIKDSIKEFATDKCGYIEIITT